MGDWSLALIPPSRVTLDQSLPSLGFFTIEGHNWFPEFISEPRWSHIGSLFRMQPWDIRYGDRDDHNGKGHIVLLELSTGEGHEQRRSWKSKPVLSAYWTESSAGLLVLSKSPRG